MSSHKALGLLVHAIEIKPRMCVICCQLVHDLNRHCNQLPDDTRTLCNLCPREPPEAPDGDMMDSGVFFIGTQRVVVDPAVMVQVCKYRWVINNAGDVEARWRIWHRAIAGPNAGQLIASSRTMTLMSLVLKMHGVNTLRSHQFINEERCDVRFSNLMPTISFQNVRYRAGSYILCKKVSGHEIHLSYPNKLHAGYAAHSLARQRGLDPSNIGITQAEIMAVDEDTRHSIDREVRAQLRGVPNLRFA